MLATRIFSVLFSVFMLAAAIASPAAALTVGDSDTFSASPQVLAVGGGSASNSDVFNGAYTLNLFDPSQGTLTGVTVSVTQTVAPIADVTFLCASSGCVGTGVATFDQSVSLNLGTVSAATGPVTGDAGGTCFGTEGCQIFSVGALSTLTASYVFSSASDLANFIGLGSFTLDRLLDVSVSISSLENSAAGSIVSGTASPWAGTATVTYEYSALVAAVPEPGSAAAFLLAVAGLFAARRRKSASATA